MTTGSPRPHDLAQKTDARLLCTRHGFRDLRCRSGPGEKGAAAALRERRAAPAPGGLVHAQPDSAVRHQPRRSKSFSMILQKFTLLLLATASGFSTAFAVDAPATKRILFFSKSS